MAQLKTRENNRQIQHFQLKFPQKVTIFRARPKRDGCKVGCKAVQYKVQENGGARWGIRRCKQDPEVVGASAGAVAASHLPGVVVRHVGLGDWER
nr:hypothetical protein Iba_chr08bCG4640 [Ipomoea batatas]